MINTNNASRSPRRALGLATALASAAGLMLAAPVQAQFKLGDVVKSVKKVAEATSYSDADIVLLFGQMADEMDRENPIAPLNDPYGLRLAELTEGLQSYDGLDLDIRAYLVSDVNAFAMGDGTVRVFAGLMDNFEDDELRCVIGHEIGHVKLEHGQKRMKRTLQQDAVLSVAKTASVDVRRLSNSELGNLFGNVVTAQHSQDAERASDDYAIRFMKANGYDAGACVTAMEKLGSLGGGGGIELLKTHPSPAARAKRMQKNLD
ncbi:MAG: M48 family metalloprotease [Pontixanthobacter sp.]